MTSSDTHSYTYDEDGNLAMENNTVTTEMKKYYFNSENRMVKFEHYPNDVLPADVISEYKYDIYGRRLSKTVNGTVTNFFWEGDNLAYEMDSSYHPIRRYFYGAGKDNTQSFVEFSEAASDLFYESNNQGWYSYIKDQVGSIIKTVKHYNDFSTTIKQSKTYDVFGNTITSSGSSTGNLGFQSKYFDTESGMYYYFNRYYKPDLGRFLNEDPISLSCSYNLYSFLNNKPIQAKDPYGLFCIPYFDQASPWYSEKYAWDKPNISLATPAFNPAGVVLCVWTRTEFGFKERLVQTREICFEDKKVYYHYKGRIYIKYGDWEQEREDNVYNHEIITQKGLGFSENDITGIDSYCCQSPWPPFNLKCGKIKNPN